MSKLLNGELHRFFVALVFFGATQLPFVILLRSKSPHVNYYANHAHYYCVLALKYFRRLLPFHLNDLISNLESSRIEASGASLLLEGFFYILANVCKGRSGHISFTLPTQKQFWGLISS